MQVYQGKIYIIILNYKGWQDTIECLESLCKQCYSNFQILVVDNSPTNESIIALEKWANGELEVLSTNFPEIVYPLEKKPLKVRIISEDDSLSSLYDEKLIVIKANENRGFSAGNNVGLRYVLKRGDFDYVWLLNNDTIVSPTALKSYVDEFKASSTKLGIMGASMVYYHTPSVYQGVGGWFNDIFGTNGHIYEGVSVDDKLEDVLIDYPIGASMLVSKDFLSEVGLLNEDYFLYFEELDWVYRGKKLGWSVGYSKNTKVYHKEGASIGTSNNPNARSEFSDIEVQKSKLIFIDNFFSFPKKQILKSTFIVVLFNRLRRKQYARFVKILRLLLG